MKKTIQEIFASILVISSLLFCMGIIVFAAISTYNEDENEYNNGICSRCGGHYHLAATDHGKFFYQCDECEFIIKIGHLINE